jgi:hypothetical protein
VQKGGYLTWFDPATGHAWQMQYFGDAPQVVDITAQMQNRSGSLRACVDRFTHPPRRQAVASPAERDFHPGLAMRGSARSLRAQIRQVTGRA